MKEIQERSPETRPADRAVSRPSCGSLYESVKQDSRADDGAGRRMVVFGSAAAVIALPACSPTVRVEPPDRPIEINLNVRIEQEVRVRIERELERVFEENQDIF